MFNRIYLDLDGVIWLADETGQTAVSSEAVRLLNKLSATWQAAVIVVSSRRNSIPAPTLVDMLKSQGIERLAYGDHAHIPLRWSQKDAITFHLTQEPGEFLIIDDTEARYLQAPGLRKRLVVPSNRFGFNVRAYKQACELCAVDFDETDDSLVVATDAEL